MIRQWLVVAVLAMLLMALGSAQAAETEEDTGCSEKTLTARVTRCAKETPEFLRCIHGGSKDPAKQCACMLKLPAMRECVGPCLPLARKALCGSAPGDVAASGKGGASSPSPSSPTTTTTTSSSSFKPTRSKFLDYQGTQMPLDGVDGIYVINLPRRPDRLKQFFASGELEPADVHVMQAFDGRDLVWSSGLDTLFGRSKFGRQRGLVASALSHFAIWRHVASTEGQFHVIFEDDAALLPGLVERWNHFYAPGLPLDAELAFLGGVSEDNLELYHKAGLVLDPVTRAFARHKATNLFSHAVDGGVDTIQPGEESRAFHYHAMAYVLSSAGARKLVDFVVTHGFVRPVDGLLLKYMRTSDRVYAATPLLTAPPLMLHNRAFGGDSDAYADTAAVPDEKGNEQKDNSQHQQTEQQQQQTEQQQQQQTEQQQQQTEQQQQQQQQTDQQQTDQQQHHQQTEQQHQYQQAEGRKEEAGEAQGNGQQEGGGAMQHQGQEAQGNRQEL